MNYQTFFRLPSIRSTPYGLIYAGLCAVLAIVPLFSDKAIVPLCIAATLALCVIAFRDNGLRHLRNFDRLLWLALGGYLLTAILASVLGDTIPDGLLSLAKLSGLAIIAALLIPFSTKLSETDIQWAAYAMISGVLIVMSWICLYILYMKIVHWPTPNPSPAEVDYLEKIRLYGYFWFKPATTVMSIISLVAGIYLQRIGRPVFAIALVVSGIVICGLIGSRTASYGLIAALTAGIVYHWLGRYRLRITLAALALAFLLPVWMVAFQFKPEQVSVHLNPLNSGANSIVYRMHIWDFVAGKITEQPLLGWGAGASKRLGTDKVGVLTDPTFGLLGEPIPVHPHNAILQVWLEFGFVGALFIYLLIARGLALADRNIRTPGLRIWVFASGTLIACFFGFSFSIASSWWLVTVIICVAIAAAFARPARYTGPDKIPGSGSAS